MKVSVFAEAFDSQYLLSAALEREHEAGKNWFAVEQNSAGAAFSKLTAVFCSGVTEILAQYLQQRLVGRECNIGFFAVQCKSYLRCLLRFNGQRGHDQSPRESILWPMRAFSYFAGCARQVCGALPHRRIAAAEHPVWPASLGSDSAQIFPRSPWRLEGPAD